MTKSWWSNLSATQKKAYIKKHPNSKYKTGRKSTTKKGPCWQGYKAIGMKTKNGRKVPNCVPNK